MILIEGQRTLGEVSREKGCIDFKKINEFALRYQQLYATAEDHYGDLESKFGDDCFGVGFEMDCGKAFIDAYGHEAIDKYEGLNSVIDRIDDPMLLGSGIFLKWRGITHWSYMDSVISDENRPWFVLALGKLAELTNYS